MLSTKYEAFNSQQDKPLATGRIEKAEIGQLESRLGSSMSLVPLFAFAYR
jgi:hypothetical protein